MKIPNGYRIEGRTLILSECGLGVGKFRNKSEAIAAATSLDEELPELKTYADPPSEVVKRAAKILSDFFRDRQIL